MNRCWVNHNIHDLSSTRLQHLSHYMDGQTSLYIVAHFLQDYEAHASLPVQNPSKRSVLHMR